jgi:hypothetical protein
MTATAATQDTTPQAKPMAPATIRPSVRQHSIKVELSTSAIGAEPSNISLADAAQDPDAMARNPGAVAGQHRRDRKLEALAALPCLLRAAAGIEPKDLTAFN